MLLRVQLALFLSAALSGLGFGQTVGNGITVTNFEIAEGELAFNPTTVGTQASHELLVANEVGVTQQIVFSGLTPPFSVSQDTLELSAQEAQVVTLYFDPSAVGEFEDEVFFAGSIFGSGSLLASGV